MRAETSDGIDFGTGELTSGSDSRAQVCLGANLKRAFSPDYDNTVDSEAVVLLNRSVTIGDDDAGRWALGCLQSGCDARCIMVENGDKLSVGDRRMLDRCTETS